MGLATVDILGLFGVGVMTAVEFGRVDEFAGWLMVPYVGWVGYAAAITVWVWWNNGGRKRVKGRKGPKGE